MTSKEHFNSGPRLLPLHQTVLKSVMFWQLKPAVFQLVWKTPNKWPLRWLLFAIEGSGLKPCWWTQVESMLSSRRRFNKASQKPHFQIRCRPGRIREFCYWFSCSLRINIFPPCFSLILASLVVFSFCFTFIFFLPLITFLFTYRKQRVLFQSHLTITHLAWDTGANSQTLVSACCCSC